MSTSLLYHGFGIVGYKYVRTGYREGNITFTVTRNKFDLRCSACKSKNIIQHGCLPRYFHSLPIGRKPIYIKAHIVRIECKDCNIIRQAGDWALTVEYSSHGGDVMVFTYHENTKDILLPRMSFHRSCPV